MDIKAIVKLLEEEFQRMTELFEKDDWKFYKFGIGGPYKRVLTHLMDKSNKYDEQIADHFGFGSEIASFTKLIVLSMGVAKTPKEKYKRMDTFKRQIKRMKIIL